MKDKSVTDIVQWLEENLHQGLLTVDHWDADMFAVGIAQSGNPTELVYISTWNLSPGRFFVELEGAPCAGSDLLRIVREHFQI
jgi:hypothetical protein